MRHTTTWALVVLVAGISCSNRSGSKQGARQEPGTSAPTNPAPASALVESETAAPVPTAVAPAKVSAEVKEDTDGPPSAMIRVDVAGKTHELVLSSDFDYCENTEASVEAVEPLGDDRLRMAQLFCDQGEDYFTRSTITALVLIGPSPKVLWQGTGSYSNSMGECQEIDVLHFRRGAAGKVEAVRTAEVVAEEGAGDCDAEPKKERVVATIDVPKPAAP
jgi:hypothetical protein